MRITEVKSFVLSKPRDLLIVKIETDEGIYGVGEAGCSTREFAQEGVLRHFREILIGMDPMRIEHIWQVCYRGAYYEGGRIITGALSAIDIALYDIAGKKLGVPVYQLLGGACRDQVHGFITLGEVDAPEADERVRAAIDDGWPAIRFFPANHIVPVVAAAAEKRSGTLDVRKSISVTAENFAELWRKRHNSAR